MQLYLTALAHARAYLRACADDKQYRPDDIYGMGAQNSEISQKESDSDQKNHERHHFVVRTAAFSVHSHLAVHLVLFIHHKYVL